MVGASIISVQAWGNGRPASFKIGCESSESSILSVCTKGFMIPDKDVDEFRERILKYHHGILFDEWEYPYDKESLDILLRR